MSHVADLVIRINQLVREGKSVKDAARIAEDEAVAAQSAWWVTRERVR